MNYSPKEIMQYVVEEDVKFIRLAFCDIFGNQKNISIMPSELDRAFKYGIAIDASAINGFNCENRSDLFLRPDTSTIAVLPWRPEHGKVVRMFCDITYKNGDIFELDTRSILKNAIKRAEDNGLKFSFGSEMEFYLFKADENGEKTDIPFDNASYMDIAPADKGENVRREICLTIEKMGIKPATSHHKEGPGQNEIVFKHSDALNSADNAITFNSVVNTVAVRNGVFADFSPKPITDKSGNGMHINISIDNGNDEKHINYIISGILKRISEITVFLNRTEDSYLRLGKDNAPQYICWSKENRSPLVRVPSADGEYKRVELRSPDPMCNPYIAYSLLINTIVDEMSNKEVDVKSTCYIAGEEENKRFESLPLSLDDAKKKARTSDFVKKYLPKDIIENYCK